MAMGVEIMVGLCSGWRGSDFRDSPGGGDIPRRGGRIFEGKKKSSFLKKKNQKTFIHGCRTERTAGPNQAKVFWFFFQKRTLPSFVRYELASIPRPPKEKALSSRE
jgi:hypothetical protein